MYGEIAMLVMICVSFDMRVYEVHGQPDASSQCYDLRMSGSRRGAAVLGLLAPML